MTEDMAKAFEALLDGYPGLMKAQDLVGFNDADERFHELIAVNARNTVLFEVLTNLQGRIRLARRYDHLRATSFQETYEEHLAIFHFMRQGDGARARRAMAGHILRSKRYIMNILARNDQSRPFDFDEKK
jgi:DNA-binding GntR family transcriptional regulator